MSDDTEVRRLLEEILNSGQSPEDICSARPDLLEEVRSRWLRIRQISADLELAFPSTGPEEPRRPDAVDPKRLPRIPGYEIKEIVGYGGMGIVYKATHLKLGRTVAVKMLLGGNYAPSKSLDGILREARMVAGLGHPNIVEVFDAGEVDDLPYFTMEFVGGGSLSEKLGGVPMPPREAAALVATLCEAVQAAHDKGVVHRDLKPGNVLLTPEGTPKIADFGLAREMGGNLQATTGAARFGTPSYMAPEQALGSSEAFNSSVDVYALGAILYETLTGRPPFRADSPIETQRQVISEEPVTPSRINQRVPTDLETICLKCLQKRSSARYASSKELHDDLRRYLAGEPIAARKTPVIVRALKWARRHPTKTTVLIFSAVLAIGAIVALAGYLATSAAARHVAEADLDEVEQAQRNSDWTTAQSALDRASLHLGAGGSENLRTRLDVARRNAGFVKALEAIRMTRALGSGSPQSFAQSNRDYATLFRDAGVGTDADAPNEAARNLRNSNIGARLIAGMYDWLLCDRTQRRRNWLLGILAIVDSDQGGLRDRSRDQAVWNDPEAFARLMADFKVSGQSAEYLLWFAELVKGLGNDPVPLLREIQHARSNDFWVNFELGSVLCQQEEEAEALRFMQAAMAIRPGMAVVHNELGNLLRLLNRFDESISELQEAARLGPTVPGIRGNLARSLTEVGRYGEAVEQLEIGLRLWPDNPMFHLDLGHALSALDRDSEAIEHYKQGAALGPSPGVTREGLLTALVEARLGKDAITMFRSWVERQSGPYEQWDGLAEFCLFVGAKDEYEQTRKTLLASFGTTRDPVACEKLARACLLAPIPEDLWSVSSAAIDRALESEQRHPTWRAPFFKLAKAASEYRAGHSGEAIHLIDAEVARVLRPMPQLITAMALSDLHRADEALSMLGRAAALFDWRVGTANSREAWMYHVLRREAESKILSHLKAFASGTYWPDTYEERLAFIATSEDRGMPLATARLFSEAFKSDPRLAEQTTNQCRYRAACAAALCGCGRAGQAIPPEEQARWRATSLRWLRDDFAELCDGTKMPTRLKQLSVWRNDRDLRCVRDSAGLARLPEDERSAFSALWAQVNVVLRSKGAK